MPISVDNTRTDLKKASKYPGQRYSARGFASIFIILRCITLESKWLAHPAVGGTPLLIRYAFCLSSTLIYKIKM
jgi:hypothetical protein